MKSHEQTVLDKEFTGYIKVYEWLDHYKGYGQGEIVGIFKVKKEWFSTQPRGFSIYHLKDEIKNHLDINSPELGTNFITLDEIKKLYVKNDQEIDRLQKLNDQLHLFLND